MKLNDLEFVRLLPQFMRNDSAVVGLAAALDVIIPSLSASIQNLSTWDHIEDLSEAELDALAWELNILWYDTGASIDTKRNVIKNSDMVYKHLGTKFAVENVIKSYFGDGEVQEWFEYDGEPGHFRVVSNNPSLSDERLTEFLNLLYKVKRASSKMDAVVISLAGQMPLYAGVAYHESGRDVFAIGATP